MQRKPTGHGLAPTFLWGDTVTRAIAEHRESLILTGVWRDSVRSQQSEETGTISICKTKDGEDEFDETRHFSSTREECIYPLTSAD